MVTDKRNNCNKIKQAVKWYIFLLLDLVVYITPQLTGYKIHQGCATVIWQGAGWRVQGANFPSAKSCNYADAAGARQALTASRSKRKSQPFMSSSAGSQANETVRFAWRARPSATAARESWCHYLVKRPCDSHCAA